MPWSRTLSQWLASAAVSLFSVSLVLALFGVPPEKQQPAPIVAPTPSTAIVPIFTKTEPAANESVLILQTDDRGVHGWVSGINSYAGKQVFINNTSGAKVKDDNTFTWDREYQGQLSVTAHLDRGNGTEMTANTTLVHTAAPDQPSIFFITDRSVYRPGHSLHFVAFLRKLLPSGEFEPVADRPVTINLTSATKGTRAAQLKLTADRLGRVVGDYTFTDADVLDRYLLSAEGFTGGCSVALAEYRKTKVALNLKGEVKDGKLAVAFEARDYLDRPVKGTAASYTATVTRIAEPGNLTLNPKEFAVQEPGPITTDRLAALPDDERLSALANGVSALTFAGFGSRLVGSREGTVAIAPDGAAAFELDLKPEWLHGGHVVTVAGVFTDDSGREHRSSTTFDLSPNLSRGVRISTPKELYATGETIPVAFAPFGLAPNDKTATTLIIVRLEASTSLDGRAVAESSHIPALIPEKPAGAALDAGWKNVPVFDPVKRVVLDFQPVANNAAEVTLKEPGAYKILAMTRLPDGTLQHSETGVVVKTPLAMPGLVLQLDRREIEAGSRLTGAVQSRFSGAKVLLTLRDSGGIKLMRTLTTGANGIARIDEVLPANLRYGCAVLVQFPESRAVIHVDERELFVIPIDRMIRVTTTAPAEAAPGAEVKLGVQIDRQEETDLIVSVYDESLRSVAGDNAPDIRSFYLADARGQSFAARDLAAARFAGVTIESLIRKAEALLADKAALEREPALEPHLRALVKGGNNSRRYITLADVVTLVRLAGLEVQLLNSFYLPPFVKSNVPITRRADLSNPLPSDQVFQNVQTQTTDIQIDLRENATLGDLMRWEMKSTNNPGLKVSIACTVIGNVAMLGLTSTSYAWVHMPNPWAAFPPYPSGHGMSSMIGLNPYGQYGFTMNGIGQFGFTINGMPGYGMSMIGINPYGQYGYYGYSGMGGMMGMGSMMGMMGMGSGMMGMSGGMMGMGGGMMGMGGGIMGMGGGMMGRPFDPNMLRSVAEQQAIGGATSELLPALAAAEETLRRDFADSAFWSATVRTDKTGRAAATFKLPDTLTNWRVAVTAVSAKMHVGTGDARIRSTRSIMVWPMLPRTFTEGDEVRIFGLVHNRNDREQAVRVHLKASTGEVLGPAEQTVKVPAKGSVPVYWSYRAGTASATDLTMSAAGEGGNDSVLKHVPIAARVLPERVTASGVVGKDALKVDLPADFDPARSSITVTIAPTLAADLVDTLPYLVEYPYGCVEQTMSRFLPAIRVAQILKLGGIATLKDLELQLPGVVAAGQKRLIELQQPDGGWAWQGSGATHEMMTPYALLGLIQSEDAGYPCPNPAAVERGLARLHQYLDQMASAWDGPGDRRWRKGEINDSLFCLTVYASRDTKYDLSPWWDRIAANIGADYVSDYGHALALELASRKGRKDLADKLAAELRRRAVKNGDRVSWTSAGFSRWGDNTTEITAAVLKALVAHDPNDPLIPGILNFFNSTKRGNRWDSTKDTACVLYALCDYLASRQSRAVAAGALTIAVNGVEGGAVKLDGPTSRSVTFSGKALKPGENRFTVSGPGTSGSALARVVVSFTRGGRAEASARSYGVTVERTVFLREADGTWSALKSGATVPAGSYLKIRATATPDVGTQFQYTLLESPKPAGCETVPAADSRFQPARYHPLGYVLREDRDGMSAFHYEHVKGDRAVLAAEYVVHTEFTGEFHIPPARVELMYKPTVWGCSSTFVLNVSEKKP